MRKLKHECELLQLPEGFYRTLRRRFNVENAVFDTERGEDGIWTIKVACPYCAESECAKCPVYEAFGSCTVRLNKVAGDRIFGHQLLLCINEIVWRDSYDEVAREALRRIHDWLGTAEAV